LPFRYRGSRRESAVAQLFSLGDIQFMYLHKEDIATLKRFQRYNHTPPTFFGGLITRGMIGLWIFFIIYIGLAILAIVTQGYLSCGCLMLGFAGGVLYMIFWTRWRSVEQWRLSREIIDWKRVDDLIREHEKHIA
jgi:hypothetical protein